MSTSPLKILISGQHGQVSRALQQRLADLGELIVLAATSSTWRTRNRFVNTSGPSTPT